MAADDTKLQIGDEFALQTIPAGEAGVDPVVGFVAASKSGGLGGSCFVDFLDGSDMEHANSRQCPIIAGSSCTRLISTPHGGACSSFGMRRLG